MVMSPSVLTLSSLMPAGTSRPMIVVLFQVASRRLWETTYSGMSLNNRHHLHERPTSDRHRGRRNLFAGCVSIPRTPFVVGVSGARGTAAPMAATLNRYSIEPRKSFTVVAVVLTVLSCIPSVVLPPDSATKVVLISTHVLASAIIVSALARQTRR
jgi:hypothetical protein